jgi:hypothetical protein
MVWAWDWQWDVLRFVKTEETCMGSSGLILFVLGTRTDGTYSASPIHEKGFTTRDGREKQS